MKVKVKIPAKINLTLDITGVKDGYHTLSSLVTSADIFDEVILHKREDDAVTLNFTGKPAGVDAQSSLAHRAARLFMSEFSTAGADIEIKRNIPAGGGLGGSSADVAGVLLGMKKLYGVTRDMTALANSLGSDTAYMLGGGYAVLSGRGDKVTPLNGIKRKFYLLIITGSRGVSTGECYAEFDKSGKICRPHTEVAARLLYEWDEKNFFDTLKNDLFDSAAKLLPEIADNLAALKKFGAASMTGSGSAVFGIYTAARERDAAYKALLPRFGASLIRAKTV